VDLDARTLQMGTAFLEKTVRRLCTFVNQHVFLSVVQHYTLQVLAKLVLNVGLVCKSVEHVLFAKYKTCITLLPGHMEMDTEDFAPSGHGNQQVFL